MKPDLQFLRQPNNFWANVRTISQQVSYTEKGSHRIRVPSLEQMKAIFEAHGLRTSHVLNEDGSPTEFGGLLCDYFAYRARVLNDHVRPWLMDAREAKVLFNRLHREFRPKCPIPMNKQKGKKKTPAFFTGLINMLIEANIQGWPCDYDPRTLTTVTSEVGPLRTLARRVDGAFPAATNPIAVWEIKEYYYTTTFGSRVADGVYETLLDGMELKELREHEGIDIKHYLMVDARFTWWDCGRSYLCRIIDMLHMGFVDEVLFGREILDRLPVIVKDWVRTAQDRQTKE